MNTNLHRLTGHSATVQKVERAIQAISDAGPVPRPVAGAIVVNRDGNILLAYSEYASQGWHFPKGGIDEGETTVEAAIRETEEETEVEARLVTEASVFKLNPSGGCYESIGFGSPRIEGEVKISQAAADLLHIAIERSGISAQDFENMKLALFDVLAKRVYVRWQTVVTYHVLAYVSGQPKQTEESSASPRWVAVEELHRISPLHSHIRQLLKQAVLENAVAAAVKSIRGNDHLRES